MEQDETKEAITPSNCPYLTIIEGVAQALNHPPNCCNDTDYSRYPMVTGEHPNRLDKPSGASTDAEMSTNLRIRIRQTQGTDLGIPIILKI